MSLGRALTREELERVARNRELALAKRAEAKRKQGHAAVGADSSGGWVSVKKPAAKAEEAVPQSVACSGRLASSQPPALPAFVKRDDSPLEEYIAAAAASSRSHQRADDDEGKPGHSRIGWEGGAKKEEFLFVLGSDNKSMAVSTIAGDSDSLAEDGPRRPAAPLPPSEVHLSEQQMAVLKAVGEGKSVFLTGSAGTGKSFLLAYAIRLLRSVLGTGLCPTTLAQTFFLQVM